MRTIFMIMILFLGSLALQGCKTATLGNTIAQYKYNELRPPTTLVPPGTVVNVEEEKPMTLGIVCSQRSAFGETFSVPESPTYNTVLVKAVSKTFEVDAGYLDRIKLNPKFTSVKNITIAMSNVRIAQLSADTVWANVAHRQESCQMAIDDFLKNKKDVAVVTAVLIADVKYHVDFEKSLNLTASAKQEVLKDLSVELGIGYETSGTQELSGTGLFWGLKTDKRLALVRADRSVDKTALREIIAAGAEAFATKSAVTSEGNIFDILADPKQAVPLSAPAGGVWAVSVKEKPEM